jgi:2-C-methyl-D-erythritol 4-phosphate cytidylyltransferase
VQQGPGGIESTSDSGRLVRVQTPQAFRAKPLLRAYRAAAAEGFEGTDTSSCIEKYTDEQVRTFPGGEANLKVTYAHDVAVARYLLSRR